jgi:predicted SAM-dependent methyltransferase
MDLDDRDGKVEVAGDVSKTLPFENETFDIMVASHILEHLEMSIVKDVIKDWMRCLKKDGKLIITVPDSRALAERYITRDIEHFIFAINMTGPYHGKDTDHHSWCYDYEELADNHLICLCLIDKFYVWKGSKFDKSLGESKEYANEVIKSFYGENEIEIVWEQSGEESEEFLNYFS